MSVLFPDYELLATQYLRDALTDYPHPVYIGRDVPAERKDYMVTVRHNGGTPRLGQRMLDRPILGVNVWAPSEQAANDLARFVRAHLTHGLGKRALASGPAEVSDETGLARRYFTVSFTARGAALHTT